MRAMIFSPVAAVAGRGSPNTPELLKLRSCIGLRPNSGGNTGYSATALSIRTASGASARVQFPNGSLVNLGEDALIGIAETRPRPGQERTDLTVLKGQVDAALETPATQSLSVSTPAATVQAGREIVFR